MSEPAGAVNVYVCQSCGTEMVTKNADEGTTPFMVGCIACDGTAYSSFYAGDQSRPHPHEWFRPKTAAQRKRWLRDEETIEHVNLGGLLLRTVA